MNMEEPPPISKPQPENDPQPTADLPPRMSLAARLLNIFAVPSDVFSEVKTAPNSTSNWLVPAILSAVVGALAAIIILSQPAIQQQLRETQAKAMEAQVKAGKITQEQADQFAAVAEKFMGPTMLKLFGTGGAVVFSFVHVLWWAFMLWLMSRWPLRVQIPFPKALEVAGLGMMINILGAIVGMLLIVNLGRMGATPSLALVVNDFDATRKSHLFLGAANIFYVWLMGVMSVGLSKLAGVPFLRAAWVVFTYWIIQETFLIMSGMGQFAL
jgi:hypothetical protein